MSGGYATARDIVGGAGLEDFPGPTDPLGVARTVRQEWQSTGLHLLHHGGDFWRWETAHWAPIEAGDVEAWLYTRLESAKYAHQAKTGVEYRAWQPNRTRIGDVVHALARLCRVPSEVELPAWFGPGSPPWSGPVVACGNGLLELGSREVYPHTSAWFNRVSVPFDHDPDAPAPMRWLEFLHRLWPDDPTAIEALRQWFGYVISGRTELHKILLLVGPPRSGKGTVAGILEALVGRGHTANPTLAGLGTNFGLAPLVGKPLAVIGDARLSGKTDGGPIVERLLSVSGEDAITIDRKYRDAWTGRLPTRFMILSNELPRLGDASGAIANRFLTLTMSTSWLGREDTTLGPELRTELPGIFRWALDGLDALTARGAFVEPQSSADAVAALHELTSPTKAFLNEATTPGGSVEVSYLWAAWQQWCSENGHPPGSVQTLSRNLRAALPALRVAQPRASGRRARVFVGLQVHPDAAPHAPFAPVGGLR